MYVPKRYQLVVLCHFGCMVLYSMRVNLSVAIVSMVTSTHTKSNVSSECYTTQNATAGNNNGEFDWDANQQALLLGAFFYGYILTQLLGGWLAKHFGGKYVFGGGVLISSALTLLIPVAARYNFNLLIATRFIGGMGDGVTSPALHSFVAQWAPPSERTKLFVITFSGKHMGTIIGMSVSGLLADSSFLGGWPSVFYVFGVAGVLWFLIWCACASNSPQLDKTISNKEREYIMNSLQGSANHSKKSNTPWLAIFKSMSVWAIIVAHVANNWVMYMVLTGLPTYFDDVLNFKLKQNGFLSALPFLAAFMVCLFSGFAADKLRKNMLSTQNIRRVLAFLAFFPAAAFLLGASYAGCSQVALSVTCMVLATGFLCFNDASYAANHLEIAPRYAGILMGITNSFASIPGFATPAITGYLTNNNPTREQYRKVFAIAAAVCAFGGTFFITFVSGTQQTWNNTDEGELLEKRINEEKTNLSTNAV